MPAETARLFKTRSEKPIRKITRVINTERTAINDTYRERNRAIGDIDTLPLLLALFMISTTGGCHDPPESCFCAFSLGWSFSAFSFPFIKSAK